MDNAKPFLKNKEIKTINEIVLKQGEDIINDDVKVAEILDITRRKSVSVLDLDDVNFSTAIDTILDHFSHSSIFNIRKYSEQDLLKSLKKLKQ